MCSASSLSAFSPRRMHSILFPHNLAKRLSSSEWQKTGHVCKPLQKATIHDFSTDWGYDECVAAIVPPSADRVNAATKHLDATHFDYEFASDGDANKVVVSFCDTRHDSSVLQLATKAWEREGYSCFPEPPPTMCPTTTRSVSMKFRSLRVRPFEPIRINPIHTTTFRLVIWEQSRTPRVLHTLEVHSTR